MANFKGFKQETLTNYNALTKEDKLNYLWLVRDVDKSGETEIVKSSAIYVGIPISFLVSLSLVIAIIPFFTENRTT